MEDNFTLLDKPLENTLEQLQQLTEYGRLKLQAIASPEYDENHIKELEKFGYITTQDATDFDGWKYLFSMTYSGVNYFENKKKHRNRERIKQFKDIIELFKF